MLSHHCAGLSIHELGEKKVSFFIVVIFLVLGGSGASSSGDDQAGLKFHAPHTPPSNPLTPASPHGILQSPPAPNIRQPSPAPPQGQPTPSPGSGFMAPSPVNNPSLGKCFRFWISQGWIFYFELYKSSGISSRWGKSSLAIIFFFWIHGNISFQQSFIR